jgi:hypothetical protein
MALKSKEWFYKQCLRHVEEESALAQLCWETLKKGIGQQDSTRGHVTQAIGAAQEFLKAHPEFRDTIRQADPTEPFNIKAYPEILAAFKAWLRSQKKAVYGHKAFGYNLKTLKGLLTPTLGGRRTGGGGGNDEFKRALRLVAEFED